jgi:hypothetical protein
MSTSKQIDKKKTFHARIDMGWRKLLRKRAFESDRSIKSLVEEALADYWGPISEEK